MDFLEMVATVVQNSARHSLKWVILGLLSTCLVSERFFFELWPDVDMSVAGELPNQHCSPHVQALHQKNDSRLARLEESQKLVGSYGELIQAVVRKNPIRVDLKGIFSGDC